MTKPEERERGCDKHKCHSGPETKILTLRGEEGGVQSQISIYNLFSFPLS